VAFYLSRRIKRLGEPEFQGTGNPRGRGVALRITASQLAITGLCAAGFGLALGLAAAGSALVGGGINTLANLYLARRLFGGDMSPRAILRNLYLGEFAKIALTVALFVIAIMTLELEFLPLFVTYAATLLAFWIALLRQIDR